MPSSDRYQISFRFFKKACKATGIGITLSSQKTSLKAHMRTPGHTLAGGCAGIIKMRRKVIFWSKNKDFYP